MRKKKELQYLQLWRLELLEMSAEDESSEMPPGICLRAGCS